MLVKSISHTPAIFVEYNGTRYMFTNSGEPVDVPPEVLMSAYKSGHIHAHELIPVDNTRELVAEIKALKERIKELEAKPKKTKR